MKRLHSFLMLGAVLYSFFFPTNNILAKYNTSKTKETPCVVVKTLDSMPEETVSYQPIFCHLGSDDYHIQYIHTKHQCQVSIEGKTINYTALPHFVGEDILTVVACDDLGICDTLQTSIFVSTTDEQSSLTIPKNTQQAPAFSFTGITKSGDFLQVGFTTNIEKIEMTVTDLAGTPVFQQVLDTQMGYNIHQIKTVQLPVGLYHISLHNARSTITSKFFNR
ncbi:MAG: hypothetical protein ACPGXL_01485 [Chitinophagales bacterium]